MSDNDDDAPAGRPASVSELKALAQEGLLKEGGTMKSWLKKAENYKKEGEAAIAEGDLDKAYVCNLKSLILMEEKIPTFPEDFEAFSERHKVNFQLHRDWVAKTVHGLKKKIVHRTREWEEEERERQEIEQARLERRRKRELKKLRQQEQREKEMREQEEREKELREQELAYEREMEDRKRLAQENDLALELEELQKSNRKKELERSLILERQKAMELERDIQLAAEERERNRLAAGISTEKNHVRYDPQRSLEVLRVAIAAMSRPSSPSLPDAQVNSGLLVGPPDVPGSDVRASDGSDPAPPSYEDIMNDASVEANGGGSDYNFEVIAPEISSTAAPPSPRYVPAGTEEVLKRANSASRAASRRSSISKKKSEEARMDGGSYEDLRSVEESIGVLYAKLSLLKAAEVPLPEYLKKRLSTLSELWA